ncbi:MAG: sigma factor-like helix-turn-helix DNA-binding protein [Solirubrobacteraceae bacterium]
MRRATYVGEWLPEPILNANGSDPARQAEIADSLSLAFLVLLESLSPEQRAVLLIRDVFGYDFDEIARVVGKTEQNARQLAERFFDAARNGDLDALERLLAHDIVLHGDGGGNAPALARSLHGRQRVARTLLAWTRHGLRDGQFSRAEVNGQPGAVGRDLTGRVVSVLALDIADGQIQGVNAIVNPDKLRGLEDPGHTDC